MPTSAPRLVVLTGGPGAGKTTLLDHLRQAGHRVVPEPREFARLMFTRDREHHRTAAQLGAHATVFFDRGIVDVVGYLRLHQLPIPHDLRRAAQTMRYHHRVFVAPPWPDIYTADTHRTQTFAEAVHTHDAITAAYREHGYELVPLPRTTAARRADIVLGG